MQAGRSLLQAEIKMHEKEMIDYIGHKQKILGLLKRQAAEIEQNSQQPTDSKQLHLRKRVRSRAEDTYNAREAKTMEVDEDEKDAANPE